MAIDTYEQAVAFLAGRTNYEHVGLPTNPGEFTLARIRTLLDLVGNPDRRFPIVHVAGTKGKGSTSAMLASISRQAGYRTGLFTSPHLTSVEERIQIDGLPVSQEDLVECTDLIERAARRMPPAQRSSLTFFEIITAIGFLHFAMRDVEIAVIEVGLGGRLDATNVCTPLISVITSISFDHTAQLGNTLSAIAREKAGIIKQGQPTVSGVVSPEAAGVISQVAMDRNAPLTQLAVDFRYQHRAGQMTGDRIVMPRVTVETSGRAWPDLELNLLGEHQAANAAVAVACVEELGRNGFDLPVSAVRCGLANVDWPARLEVVGSSPAILLDCAHNVASVRAALNTIQTTFCPSRRGLIFACSNDKDLSGMMALLTPHFHRVWFTQYSTSTRGTRAEELESLWRQQGGAGCEVVETPLLAIQAARNWAESDDLICVLGSVFLAGEIRSAIGSECDTRFVAAQGRSIARSILGN